MHIRHLAVIQGGGGKSDKQKYTLAKKCAHMPQEHTQKYIFNIIMTSRTLQESQQDWDSTQ